MIIFMFSREQRMQLLSVDISKREATCSLLLLKLVPCFVPVWHHQGVGWETMEHRKGKVPKSNKDEADLSGQHAPTQIMSTNVQMPLLFAIGIQGVLEEVGF